MNRILNNWIILIFSLSIIAIGSAFIAQYYFNLMPCKMCLKQRHPYYVIIVLTALFYLLKKHKSIYLFVMNEIAIVYGLFYSIWHVGIEQKILTGPASCSIILSETNSLQDLKEQINNQPIINCSDIVWTILGLSATTINTILLLFILIFNSIFIIKNYYVSK